MEMVIDLWIQYDEASLDDVVSKFHLLDELRGPQVTYSLPSVPCTVPTCTILH